MSDLIDFLRARLIDDAGLARLASDRGDGVWKQEYPSSSPGLVTDSRGEYVVYGSMTSFEQAAHIARHDPASVMVEIDAKRLIVNAYLPPGADPHPGLPCTNDIEGDPDGEVYAEMVHPDACVRHVEASKRLLHHDYVLRLLALPYASHPDYRPEWAPDA